jgi:hypothetical protein
VINLSGCDKNDAVAVSQNKKQNFGIESSAQLKPFRKNRSNNCGNLGCFPHKNTPKGGVGGK